MSEHETLVVNSSKNMAISCSISSREHDYQQHHHPHQSSPTAGSAASYCQLMLLYA